MSRTVLHYGLVLVLVATALAISLLLQPFIPHGFVYLFLAAVVVSAWRGNSGPVLFAVVLASLTLDYFFLPPLHTLGIGRGAWSYFFPFLLSALAVVWMNSTRKREQEALAARTRLATLYAGIGTVLTEPGTLREGLQGCTEVWVHYLAATCARIWTLNETTQVLELEASAGIVTRIDDAHARVPVGQFIIGKVAQECKPKYSNNIFTDDWTSDSGWTQQQGVVACASYPLISESRPIGVIAVFARRPFSETVIQDLAVVAGRVAQFIKRKRAEAALRESEEQFRQLADNIREVFFILTPGVVRMTYISPAYDEIFGRPRQALYERPEAWMESTHPDDRERVGGFYADCMQGIQSEMEYRVVRPDGSVRWIEARGFPVRDSQGNFIRVVGIAEDITVRKQTEKKLQDSESKHRVLFTDSADANLLMDEKGFVDCNSAALQMFGYATPAELMGLQPSDFSPPNQPDGTLSQTKSEQKIANAFLNGQNRFEWLHRRRDGQVFPAEVCLTALTLSGRPALLGTVRDITERKHAEQEILFKNTLLEAQTKASIDGILAVDDANRIILSNEQFATMWGVPPTMVRTGDDNYLLQFVVKQTENPQLFLEKVRYLYSHREEKSRDELRLKDGKVFDRYSAPLIDSTGRYRGRIWYFRDMTDRFKSEEQLRLWSQVLEQSAEGIFICDPQEQILLVNTAFEQLTGYSAAETLGKTPRILQSQRQDRAFYTDMWKSISETGSWRGEMWNRRKSGEIYVEWLSISAVYDQNGAMTHYIGIFSDITVRKQGEERMVHLAHYDALTDLPNRVLLMDRLSQLTKSTQRRKFKIAVVFIDLDRFKEVNDSLGHDAGDLLLQTIAKRLSSAVRDEDTVARLGGDEFVVVFQSLHEIQDVAVLAQKLLSCLVEPVNLNGYELTVTASMGISVYPDDAANGQEMIRNADAAMYQAKGTGRNAFHFYTSDLNQHALEMLSMENALRRALERQEFVLHYQPQIDIASGFVVGAEALIRWNHPELGLTMPGKFISIAEERGLIVSIGSWVIQEAARQAAVWQHSTTLSIPIAVNVSAVQFRQKDFVEQLANSVRKHGIAPNRLELELTESIIMRDAETAVEIVKRLHDLGFRLSIDDFGTGYSSLSYLRRFPIDKIKIDQTFVTDLTQDESAGSIVTAVIGLARSLKLKVIAEGVQKREQLEILDAQGCDEAQGFLFSPALASGEFEKLVREWKPQYLGSRESLVGPSK